jgi:asparagine synthase (glutamine-hydrolysing)
MCGIVGFVKLGEFNLDKIQFNHIVESLRHRGPDGLGVIHEEKFSFGHTRLSIIDLSDNAKQPMSDLHNEIFITYNGEIYNYLEIKKELCKLGHKFNNKSDTEVIIESYKQWGIDCINKFVGAFAFGLYDKRNDLFYLVRDRLGVKPVYYSYINNCIIFCSELKGIINFMNFKKDINFRAISCFLSFRYCIGKETYFNNVSQLLPGHYLEVKSKRIELKKYWDLTSEEKFTFLGQRYKCHIKNLIQDAVIKRTISDVPIGLYLSGGIDSTVILAEMSKKATHYVNSFTAKFGNDEYDEDFYSNLAAKKFKANVFELIIKDSDYIDNIVTMIKYKDQPLGMHNEVALYLLAKELKKSASVALSGEGADELLFGYGRIFRTPFDYKRSRLIEKLSSFLKIPMFKNINVLNNESTNSEFDYFLSRYTYFPFEEKFMLFNERMKEEIEEDKQLIQYLRKEFEEVENLSYYDKISRFFVKIHLPGLLLMMDATSMAAGVEVRVPFVDHRIVEEMFKISWHYKIRWKNLPNFIRACFTNSEVYSEECDVTKYILKELYKDELPLEILTRKKMGFPVPLEVWFANNMKCFVREKLLSEKAKIKLIFDQENLKQWIEKNEHNLSIDYGRKIWRILNLEFWLEEYAI